jgi:exonuclease III
MCNSGYSNYRHTQNGPQNCLRVGYWNVEGINTRTGSKLDDPVFIQQIEQYDIIALAETHAVACGTLFLKGFKAFEVTRRKHKRAKKGSGGIAIFVKDAIRPYVALHHGSSPDSAWVQLKHQFFNTSEDIFIGAAYISPQHSSYTVAQETPAWDFIRNDVEKFGRRGKVIVIGDLNTRSGDCADFILHDDDQYMQVPDSYETDEAFVFKSRRNMDPTVSPPAYVSQLTDMCKESGLRILNGRMLGDTAGKLTCYKWNGNSTVDYGIAHYSLFRYIQYFKVHDFLEALSDHCRISMVMNLTRPLNGILNNADTHDMPAALKLSPETVAAFKNHLTAPESEDIINRFSSNEFHNLDVNCQASEITNYITIDSCCRKVANSAAWL